MGESIMNELAFGRALHLLLLITSTPQDKIIDKHRAEAHQLIHQHNNVLSQYIEYKEGDK
jgi:hypothetical protein